MDNLQSDMNETLITLTSDIVAAHVSNNNVSSDEVTALINNVYKAFAGLGAPAEPEATPLKPAVSARASVKPDKVICMDCGMELQMLKRQLAPTATSKPEAPLTPQDVIELRQRCNAVTVTEPLQRYILALVRGTRDDSQILLGASPRGAIALQRDIQAKIPVLTHNVCEQVDHGPG